MNFLDNSEINKIEKSLKKYDTLRDELIIKSREIIKQSKVVINSVHRQENNDSSLKQLIKLKKEMDSIITSNDKLSNEGSAKIAYQEFAEAALITEFSKSNKISYKNLNINEECYLLGLCDLTGELSRIAVRKATNKKYKEVKRIFDCIEEIHTFFLKMDLRNSELRKKSDQIKWNLKKVEEILYDISMRG